MFAVMVPVSAFSVGPSVTTYLLIAAVLSIALASNLPAANRRYVKAAALALGGSVMFANIIIMCSDWIWCW